MPKSRKQTKKQAKLKGDDRIIDLLERLGAIGLYFLADMDHHAIARRLGMGTQRVTAILKGLKKPPKKQHAEKTK